MSSDPERAIELVLALMQLTLHEGDRTWKSFDWDVVNDLLNMGYISHPRTKGEVGGAHGWPLPSSRRRPGSMFKVTMGPGSEVAVAPLSGMTVSSPLPSRMTESEPSSLPHSSSLPPRGVRARGGLRFTHCHQPAAHPTGSFQLRAGCALGAGTFGLELRSPTE